MPKLDFRPYTKSTLTTPEALWADLKATRNRGYSIDAEEFSAAGTCYGAAVLDYSGQPVGAISVSGLTSRITGSPAAGPLVTRTAEKISELLGHNRARPHGSAAP